MSTPYELISTWQEIDLAAQAHKVTPFTAEYADKLNTIDNWDSWTETLINKTIDDQSNTIHADANHVYVQAIGDLVHGDIVTFDSYEAPYIKVTKRTDTHTLAFAAMHDDTINGEIGGALISGILKNCTKYTNLPLGVPLYPSTDGGLTDTPIISYGAYSQPVAFALKSNSTESTIQFLFGMAHDVAENIAFNNTGLNLPDNVDLVLKTLYTNKAEVNHTHDGVYEPYDENIVSDSAYVHTDNNYTTAEKEELAALSAGGALGTLLPYEKPNSMRVLQHRLHMLSNGITQFPDTTPVKANMIIVGDSWTDHRTSWLKGFTDSIVAKYGDGGIGWAGFGAYANNIANMHLDSRGKVGVNPVGTWTYMAYWGNGIDCGYAYSSTVGDQLRCIITDATDTKHYLTGGVYLHAKANTGVIRYSWNFGTDWYEIDLTGTDYIIEELANAPIGYATTNVWIEVVSGTPELYGIDIRSTNPGVVVHKAAISGASYSVINNSNLTLQAEMMATLNPDSILVFLGTNDQDAETLEEFTDYSSAYLTNIRSNLSNLIDFCFVMPPENNLGRTLAMSDMSNAIRGIAKIENVSFIDLQESFGELDEYKYAGDGSTRDWLDSTDSHPTKYADGGGGVVIAQTIMKYITQDIDKDINGADLMMTRSVSNLDLISKTGIYIGTDVLNSPFTGAIIVTHYEYGNASYQFLSAETNTTLIHRQKRSGVWSSWAGLPNTAQDVLDILKDVDGSGSGLDADLLDGQEGSYYLNIVNDTTPQLGGNLDCNSKEIQKPAYSKSTARTESSGTLTIDFTAGTLQKITVSANVTTVGISNFPTNYGEVIIEAVNWGAYTFPTGMLWDSGVFPTLTSSGTDFIKVSKNDAGMAIWSLMQLDVKATA